MQIPYHDHSNIDSVKSVTSISICNTTFKQSLLDHESHPHES